MSAWQSGDTFELEADGEIIHVGETYITVRLGSQITFGSKWFEAHATKTRPNIVFGDYVYWQDRDGERNVWLVYCARDPEWIKIASGEGGECRVERSECTLVARP